jgi:hypothetical protein
VQLVDDAVAHVEATRNRLGVSLPVAAPDDRAERQ